MAYYPATIFPPQFFADNSVVLSGGSIEAYIAGTSTPTNMFTDSVGTIAGTSITLNARGEPQVSGNTVNIWLDASVSYKFVLKDASDVTKWTIDGISAQVAGGITYNQGGTGAGDQTIEQRLQQRVSVKDFLCSDGQLVQGDGSHDDTTGIQAAIDWAEANAPEAIYLPAGTYKVTSTLTIDSGGVGLIGAGPFQTFIRGNFAAGDIIHVDGSVGVIKEFSFRDFCVDSSVTKGSGGALHLQVVGDCSIRGVRLGRQSDIPNGTRNLWDGFVLNQTENITITDYWTAVLGTACRINGGTAGLSGFAIINEGRLSGEGKGLHLAGGAIFVQVDKTDINDNDDQNVLIDQSVFASGNAGLFIGSQCAIDGQSVGGVRQQPGIVVNDPGLKRLFLDSVWINLHTYGIHIQDASATETHIQIHGGRIAEVDNDCIKIDAEVKMLMIDGVNFADAPGFGINSTVDFSGKLNGNGVLVYPNNRFTNCDNGDVSWDTIPALPGSNIVRSIGDDSFYAFTPRDHSSLEASGFIAVHVAGDGEYLLAHYRAASGAAALTDISSSGITATTGALAGTTGADGTFTVASHTDGMIYIENRSGAAHSIVVHLLGAYPGANHAGDTI